MTDGRKTALHAAAGCLGAVGALAVLAVAHASCAAPIAIVPDGEVSEWQGIAIESDPAGDGRTGERDLMEAAVFASSDQLSVRMRFDRTSAADEQPGLWLVIDGDFDATTGDAEGAELRFDLGAGEGRVYALGADRAVGHVELGLCLAPTVTARDWELVLPRNEEIFPGERLRWYVYDAVGGDRLPDEGWIETHWGSSPTPVIVVPLQRATGADFRFVTWNVEHDGFFERTGRRGDEPGEGEQRWAAQARLLRQLDPDLLVICEAWNHSGEQLLVRLSELTGTDWSGWHAGQWIQGTTVLSRWPIEQSWEVLPIEGNDQRRRRRLVASLVRMPDRPPLLVVANHWRCCQADERRQEEADALAGFLRDAWTPGGRIDLAAEAGIVLAGDFNLVGDGRQLITLLHGDIADEARFGPDHGGDADGSSLRAASARHPEANRVHTWARTRSRYYPGRLDWVVYSDSALEELRALVIDTRTMHEDTLHRLGWNRDDSERASDHSAVAVDFRWR